jgi:hypothetical protein
LRRAEALIAAEWDFFWIQGGSCEGFGKMVILAASLSSSNWTPWAVAAFPARLKMEREGGMMRRSFTNGSF